MVTVDCGNSGTITVEDSQQVEAEEHAVAMEGDERLCVGCPFSDMCSKSSPGL